MNKLLLTVSLTVLFISGCASSVTREEVSAAASRLDFGNYQSSTLATKGWEALADRDYAAVIAYTEKCVELYGDRGKEMNAELTAYAPVERVNNYWALNDAGTCMYIMATAYEEMRMWPEASQAFRSLAEDYYYAQCWDPQGWYWYPASGAAAKAKNYEYK